MRVDAEDGELGFEKAEGREPEPEAPAPVEAAA